MLCLVVYDTSTTTSQLIFDISPYPLLLKLSLCGFAQLGSRPFDILAFLHHLVDLKYTSSVIAQSPWQTWLLCFREVFESAQIFDFKGLTQTLLQSCYFFFVISLVIISSTYTASIVIFPCLCLYNSVWSPLHCPYPILHTTRLNLSNHELGDCFKP